MPPGLFLLDGFSRGGSWLSGRFFLHCWRGDAQNRFLEDFGGREAQPRAGRNLDLFTGSGIAPDPGRQLALAKDTQSP